MTSIFAGQCERLSVVRLLVIGTLMLAGPQYGAAQDSPQESAVEEHYRRGQELYREQKYDRAASELRKAYALRPLPMLQYNIALAEWRAGRLDVALEAAKKARAADLPDKVRLKLDARIVAIERALTARELAGRVAELPVADAPRTTPAGPDGASKLSTLGWVGTTLAVAGVGLGAGAWYVDAQLADDDDAFEAAARQGDRTEYNRRLAELEDRQTVGRALAVGGLALGAAGVTMIVWDLTDTPEAASPTMSLSASPADGGARVGLRLWF